MCMSIMTKYIHKAANITQGSHAGIPGVLQGTKEDWKFQDTELGTLTAYMGRSNLTVTF